MNSEYSERLALLQQIFDNVNNWLHFAEAKNGALIAFNIAFMTVIMDSNLEQYSLILYTILMVGMAISTFAILLSFKPINKELPKTDVENIKVNLLHYAYIASLEKEEYMKALYAGYWNETNKNINSIPQIEKDYCAEIIENARITMRKQKFFKDGFRIVLLMILVFIVLVICA